MEPATHCNGTPQPTPRSELQIVEIDPALVRPAPGNRVVTPDSVSDLLPSMERDDQLVPAIVYPDPERPGHYLGADGNRRAMCQRILGRKLKAYVLSVAPTEQEIIRIRTIANFHRKNASAYELAADIKRWMELTEGTQRLASDAFGISAPQICKILAKAENASPEVRQAEESGAICPDVARIISGLPSRDVQREALQQTIQRDLKRDAVEDLVMRMRGDKRQKKMKPVKARTPKGLQAIIPACDYDCVLGELGVLVEAVRRAQKHGLPLSSLPSLLRSG